MYITIFNGNELIFQFKYEEEDILWQPLHQSDSSFSWTDKWSQLRTAQYMYIVEHLQSLVKALLQKLFLTTMSISADFFSPTFLMLSILSNLSTLVSPSKPALVQPVTLRPPLPVKISCFNPNLIFFWFYLSLLVNFPDLLWKQVGRETWLIYPQRPQDLKNHEHFLNEHK